MTKEEQIEALKREIEELNKAAEKSNKFPSRPPYFWLEEEIFRILFEHDKKIITEIVQIIEKEDKNRTLA